MGDPNRPVRPPNPKAGAAPRQTPRAPRAAATTQPTTASPAAPKPKPYSRSSEPTPPFTPQLTKRDPSIPTIASTSKNVPEKIVDDVHHIEQEKKPWYTRLCIYCYNKQNKTACDRTFDEWWKIVCYAIMYLMFLATFTMILLFISLTIIKNKIKNNPAKLDLMMYDPNAVGLTAVPVAVHNFPLIWYRHGEPADYEEYLTSLDKLLEKKAVPRAGWDLGPCGQRPYGYGEQPCVVVKINKQWTWNAKPLQKNSPNINQVPSQVKEWLQKDSQKYWLHCRGYHSYDTEHLGMIKYYPDPPGFDSTLFPLDGTRSSPLVAIQFSNFTLGISLAIECKLWYENGQADTSFMLYVKPKSRLTRA